MSERRQRLRSDAQHTRSGRGGRRSPGGGGSRGKLAVYLEAGQKRTFACAVDWPGLCRSGRTDDEAIAALIEHAPRYAAVVKDIDGFTPPDDAGDVQIVDRISGSASTDFGVPSHQLPSDEGDVGAAELRRLESVLEAAWSAFDDVARRHRHVELRKGPRGGGRDLDRIVVHVFEAESAYCHQLGSKQPKAGPDRDVAAAMATLRQRSLEALAARAAGRPPAEPNKVGKPWPPRYFVRRSAWHALDHAWEIEDRALPSPDTTEHGGGP